MEKIWEREEIGKGRKEGKKEILSLGEWKRYVKEPKNNWKTHPLLLNFTLYGIATVFQPKLPIIINFPSFFPSYFIIPSHRSHLQALMWLI